MDSWLSPLADRFELTRRVWSLRGGGHVLAPQLRLLPDGRLGCCPLDTLAGWELRGEALVLLDAGGRAAAVLDEPGDDGAAAMTFAGVFADDEGVALALAETEPVERAPPPERRRTPLARDELHPRRHLVVATAAAIAGWADDLDGEDRSWDVCLLDPPDELPDEDVPDWEVTLAEGAGRWDGLHELVFPGSPLLGYDHVLFAPDRARWSQGAANEMFAVARAHDLLLAHPVLARGPGVPTRLQPASGRRLGFATALAAHCPLFSAEALRVCAPSFGLAGEGEAELPLLWAALLGRPLTRIAAIDGIAPLELAAGTRAAASGGGGGLLDRYGLAGAEAREAGELLLA